MARRSYSKRRGSRRRSYSKRRGSRRRSYSRPRSTSSRSYGRPCPPGFKRGPNGRCRGSKYNVPIYKSPTFSTAISNQKTGKALKFRSKFASLADALKARGTVGGRRRSRRRSKRTKRKTSRRRSKKSRRRSRH